MAEEANNPKISELASVPAPKAAKSSKGWMVAAIICAIGFLGTGGYTIYNLVNGNSGTQKDTSEGGNATDCIVKSEVSGADGVDTGTVAQTQNGDYVVNFYKSGLKLNLGSGFEFINLSYSSSPSSDMNYVERVAIGGLSTNTTGAQNIPDFARGEVESLNSGNNSWTPLAIITVYTREYWDANMQPGIDEAEANGVSSSASKWYKDENYAVSYSHPQGVVSPEGWERDWELASVEALQAAIEDSNSWSK